ncbi:FG-GAP repeat protein [Streptomyces sp. PTD9-10]|uniref:FG-GAP repeat protein n=1 Tax=Streptomyces sp. PTD9-10 TaxID=3120151 RepID=UPI003FCE6D99
MRSCFATARASRRNRGHPQTGRHRDRRRSCRADRGVHRAARRRHGVRPGGRNHRAQDFDGDGYQDLAVAAPAARVGGHPWAGYVAISYGSAAGLAPARTTIITQDTPGVPGPPATTTASATR